MVVSYVDGCSTWLDVTTNELMYLFGSMHAYLRKQIRVMYSTCVCIMLCITDSACYTASVSTAVDWCGRVVGFFRSGQGRSEDFVRFLLGCLVLKLTRHGCSTSWCSNSCRNYVVCHRGHSGEVHLRRVKSEGGQAETCKKSVLFLCRFYARQIC